MTRKLFTRSYEDLIHLLKESQDDPHNAGVSTKSKKRPTDSLKWAIQEIEKWQFEVDAKTKIEYWKHLADEAISRLENQEEYSNNAGISENTEENTEQEEYEGEIDHSRILRAVPVALLSAIHIRIDSFRRKRYSLHGQSNIEDKTAFYAEAQKLIEKVERALKNYGY